MTAGDLLDLTLRSMRVAEVKPMSTLYVGTLPNGEPFEVRVPFDADMRTAALERTVQCACILVEDLADHTHRCALYVDAGPHDDCNHICAACGRQWKGGAL